MVATVEPGFYKADHYGIHLESVKMLSKLENRTSQDCSVDSLELRILNDEPYNKAL